MSPARATKLLRAALGGGYQSVNIRDDARRDDLLVAAATLGLGTFRRAGSTWVLLQRRAR